MIQQLITQLSILMSQVIYAAFPLGTPLLNIRDALILVSDLPQEYEEVTKAWFYAKYKDKYHLTKYEGVR